MRGSRPSPIEIRREGRGFWGRKDLSEGTLMNDDLIKINALTIAASGTMMLLTGLSLLLFRDTVVRNIRYFLPIPPIGVAAYIFVFNMFRAYGGSLPGSTMGTIRELAVSTLVMTLVFAVFVTANVALTYVLNRLI